MRAWGFSRSPSEGYREKQAYCFDSGGEGQELLDTPIKISTDATGGQLRGCGRRTALPSFTWLCAVPATITQQALHRHKDPCWWRQQLPRHNLAPPPDSRHPSRQPLEVLAGGRGMWAPTSSHSARLLMEVPIELQHWYQAAQQCQPTATVSPQQVCPEATREVMSWAEAHQW